MGPLGMGSGHPCGVAATGARLPGNHHPVIGDGQFQFAYALGLVPETRSTTTQLVFDRMVRKSTIVTDPFTFGALWARRYSYEIIMPCCLAWCMRSVRNSVTASA